MPNQFQRHAFRWPSDGDPPFRLGQRRVFILPTRAGLFFALALGVMLLGAINYNLALGHALVFLLAGLGICGMVHTFRNLHGLGIAPGRCTPVFAGETAYFPLQLTNDRPTPRLMLVFTAEPDKATTCALPALGTGEVTIPLGSVRRGWLPLPRVRLSTVYPLGLFVAWSDLQPRMHCLVYPRPLPGPLPPGPSVVGNDSHGSNGGHDDFAGLRERRSADALHHVAWKASARAPLAQTLLVKQFAGGGTERLLDWDLTNPALPLETRISQMAGWVLAADADGGAYALRLPGHEIGSASGRAHRERCLELLALFPP